MGPRRSTAAAQCWAPRDIRGDRRCFTKEFVMEIGIFGVGAVATDPHTGYTPTENERIQSLARIAVHAEEIGMDVYAIGEHHNKPFISSADTTLLAYIAAKTSTITLSTS